MVQIIVGYQQLSKFSERLGEHATHVNAVRNKLIGGLKGLRGTWQDERYRQFDNELTATMGELERFVRSARQYAEYLDRKALAAKRYLNRTR